MEPTDATPSAVRPHRRSVGAEARAAALAAVRANGDALLYAQEASRADKEVVVAAVRRNGRVLMSASKALRNDREVVLAAVRQDGDALAYVSIGGGGGKGLGTTYQTWRLDRGAGGRTLERASRPCRDGRRTKGDHAESRIARVMNETHGRAYGGMVVGAGRRTDERNHSSKNVWT